MKMLLKIALVGVLVLSTPSTALTQCGDRTGNEPGKLQLVLDASGSMSEADASGATKIQAAKQALGAVVDELPEDARVGMRVFGATVFDRSESGACTDSQEVVPVGPLDRAALKSAVDAYEPYGETPLAYAMQEAAKDLGGEGQRTIVLVSDGEETCDQDPAAVAAEIREQGIDLRIDVVGFDVSGDTRRQLERIAQAGGGIYLNATNADELRAVLGQSALSPFRGFDVAGTPVQGTEQPAGAPELSTGSVFYGPHGHSGAATRPGEECARADRLLLEIERTGQAQAGAAADPDPMELVVTEEPPVNNVDTLPPAVGQPTQHELTPSRPVGEVVGAANFNDAPEVTPGTWTDTIQPGEQLLYKVYVDWGQAVSVTFHVPGNPGIDARTDRGGVHLKAYAPDRMPVTLALLGGRRTGSWTSKGDGLSL